MRFNASNLENTHPKEQLGELLVNINGVVGKTDSSGN